jgi:hypothetical protein
MPSFFNQRSDWSPLLRLALNRRVTTQETRPAQPALKGLAAPNVAPSTHRLVKELCGTWQHSIRLTRPWFLSRHPKSIFGGDCLESFQNR